MKVGATDMESSADGFVTIGKQRKNRAKTVRGTAKTKGAGKDKKKK